MAVMSLVRPYKERDYAALAASGARQIRPRRNVHYWPVTDDDAETAGAGNPPHVVAQAAPRSEGAPKGLVSVPPPPRETFSGFPGACPGARWTRAAPA